jgi:O-antigen ligase
MLIRVLDFVNNHWGRISFYLAFCIMVVIPINVIFISPLMIAWFFLWLLIIRKQSLSILKIEKPILVLFILSLGLYIWQFIGIFYSSNTDSGWNNIIKRTSMLVFPIILTNPALEVKSKVNYLLRVFCISTFTFMLICFAYATYNSVSFSNGIFIFDPHLPVQKWMNFYYGTELAIYQHPSYLSMYALFSMIIGLDTFFNSGFKLTKRIIFLIISILLMVFIYFLSARAAILSSIIILSIYLIAKSVSLNKLKYSLIFIILGLVIIGSVLIGNQRVSMFTRNITTKSFSEAATQESRLAIWKTALRISGKNLLFGVGTGDVNDELVKEYYRMDDKLLVEKKFNTHNQFIEVLLENGLIGEIIFLSIFVTMFYISFIKKNIYYFLFTITIILLFSFESMLYRIAGIAFFSVFSFLLLYNENRNSDIPFHLE